MILNWTSVHHHHHLVRISLPSLSLYYIGIYISSIGHCPFCPLVYIPKLI